MTQWKLELLGKHLLSRGNEAYAPERKMAGILGYLALEGPTARSKLAGLLWPDSVESTARNNLAQTLRRLKKATGEELVVGGDVLRLRDDIAADAPQLKIQSFSGNALGIADVSGELLEHLDYDDCPDFSDWLWAEREHFRELQTEVLQRLVDNLEKQGSLREALHYTEQLIALDPLAEASYRHAMRLHYLMGDRAAVLKTYHRCKEVLAQELGIEPLSETAELARAVDQGIIPVALPERKQERSMPVEVLRPPILVGREDAWARMEEAWRKGQSIYITGEPGVGKTRLAQEFVASKGQGVYLPARPGYQDVPYAAAANLARARLAAAPGVVLPDRVRHELSRILPELQNEGEVFPSQSEANRLQFFQAYAEMVRLTGRGFVASISDDTQYYDQATVELGGFLMSHHRSLGGDEEMPRYVVVFRRGELPPATQAIIDKITASELAVLIDLSPLDIVSTTSLLASLRLDALNDEVLPVFAEAVHRRTGGNMQFMLETIRGLIETERLGKALPEQLPLPSKVETVIRQRLARLSQAAQRVVQVAAIMQTDFDLDVVSKILEMPALELITPWEELERAHVLNGNRFSHDLIYETVQASISHPVRMLLHQRIAEALEGGRTDPARIAKHWLESREPQRAVPWLFKAAERAEAAFLLQQAFEFYKRARSIAEEKGSFEDVFEALFRKAHYLVLERVPSEEPPEQVVSRLSARAVTPAQRAQANYVEAVLYYRRGQAAASIAAAQRGIAELQQVDNKPLQINLLFSLGTAHWLQNQFREAESCFQEMIQGARSLGNERQAAYGLTLLGQTASWLAHDRQALDYYERAKEVFERIGDRFRLAHTLTNTGTSLEILGQYGKAEQVYLQADQVLGKEIITTGHQAHNIAGLAHLYIGQEKYTDAYNWLKQKKDLASIAAPFRGLMARTWALLYLVLGQHEHFDSMITAALEQRHRTDPLRSYANIIHGLGLAQRGSYEQANTVFAETERSLMAGAPAILLARLWLSWALSLSPDEALACARKARVLIEEKGFVSLRVLAEIRLAQSLFAVGEVEEALRHSSRAVELDKTEPLFGQRAELLLTHYRALHAVGKSEADGYLQMAFTHVRQIAAQWVPEEYREGFLKNNPLNAVVVEAYREAQHAVPLGLDA